MRSYLVFVEACKLLLGDIIVKSHGCTLWLHNEWTTVSYWQYKSPTLAAESKYHLASPLSFTPGEEEVMSCRNIWATPTGDELTTAASGLEYSDLKSGPKCYDLLLWVGLLRDTEAMLWCLNSFHFLNDHGSDPVLCCCNTWIPLGIDKGLPYFILQELYT